MALEYSDFSIILKILSSYLFILFFFCLGYLFKYCIIFITLLLASGTPAGYVGAFSPSALWFSYSLHYFSSGATCAEA